MRGNTPKKITVLMDTSLRDQLSEWLAIKASCGETGVAMGLDALLCGGLVAAFDSDQEEPVLLFFKTHIGEVRKQVEAKDKGEGS